MRYYERDYDARMQESQGFICAWQVRVSPKHPGLYVLMRNQSPHREVPDVTNLNGTEHRSEPCDTLLLLS